MTTEPVRAGSDWLALREPSDAAARAVELVEELRACLPVDGAEIHDLGCGTGSMARWLAARLTGRTALGAVRPGRRAARARRGRPAGCGRRRCHGHRGDASARHHPPRPGGARGGCPRHRLCAARHADRRRAPAPGRHLCGRGLPGADHAQRHRSRRPRARRPVRPPRHGRVQRPSATHHQHGTPPRPGRGTRRRGLLPPAGPRRRGPTQPVAPRPRPVRAGGGVVHRLAGARPASNDPSCARRRRPTDGAGCRRPPPARCPSPCTTGTCWPGRGPRARGPRSDEKGRRRLEKRADGRSWAAGGCPTRGGPAP